jgi:hypothetical protein
MVFNPPLFLLQVTVLLPQDSTSHRIMNDRYAYYLPTPPLEIGLVDHRFDCWVDNRFIARYF